MLDPAVDGARVRDEAFDAFALDGHDDAQLDDLPFGVICLDARGTILRYNLAEARLARLDRSQVLGRDFFRQIAPCTATQGFEGRFRSFVAGQEPRVAFPYIFDFKFGAQEVHVELVAVAHGRRARLDTACEGAADVRQVLARLDGAGGGELARAGDVLARLF